MPEISVIVPVYNAAAFLKECIESVLAQSFNDWELILVDDGSTDNSNQICRRFGEKDSRIRLIEQSNSGVSAARNVALDQAKGTYVTFLDADDELYPDSLDLLHGLAKKFDVAIVAGQSVNAPTKPNREVTGGGFIADGRSLCRDMLYRKGLLDTSVWGKIYLRTVFDGIRFYDGKYEDLEIFHKLLVPVNRVMVIREIVYFYRDNPGSFINTWSEKRRDAVKVTQGITDCYAKDPVLGKASLNRHFRASYNLLLLLLRYRPDDKEGIDSCYENIKSLRMIVLSDNESVLSTRVGALASFGGLKLIRMLSLFSQK